MSQVADFDQLWIWNDPNMRARMSWYRGVAVNRMPAKYLIARRIPLQICLSDDEDRLWQELERVTPRFLELWSEVRDGQGELDMPSQSPNLVDLCVELSQRMLRHCNFCRWNCKVDRGTQGGKHGTCQLEATSRVSSYFHHRGEELVYRGRMGSGTIFFTSCNMRCAFCQNGDISTDKDNGTAVSPRQLALMAWQLRQEGCHNVNFVGGEVTIHLHTIVEAISLLDTDIMRPVSADLLQASLVNADGFLRYDKQDVCYRGEPNVPILWNSNFFMTEEAMRILHVLVDVWLPDFKFGSDKCSIALSRTPWYWETITSNLRRIESWGEDFTIRHLIMPNHVDCCTKPVLDWIAQNMPEAPVNVMDQYHPDTFCDPSSKRYKQQYEPISRRPTTDEIRSSFAYARSLGLHFEPITYEKQTTSVRP